MLASMTATPAAGPVDDLPEGDPVPGWTTRPMPEPVVLQGFWCRLEPLSARHADELFAAVTAPGAADRTRYLPESVPDRAGFDAWLQQRSSATEPRFWAVLDADTGRCGGRQALLRTVPEHGVTELGHVLWGPGVARTRIATEALYLTACHVFDTLGYRRLEWKCNDRNLPSRRAARRFGFAFEGIFRQHMVIKGVSRDTAWYAMTDGDWARLRPAYQDWLDPANFDPGGTQREPLAPGSAAEERAEQGHQQ
jgi:RimJ/RimL family protein N-acetyltransferase